MPAKRYVVRLTDGERRQLESMVKKGKAAAYKIRHAHILLKTDADGANWTDAQIAEAFGCHRTTVEDIRKLSTAGVAGQFRTPRHIIRAMVEILEPRPDETVCDPACGTGGFLTQTMDYLKQRYTSPGLEELETDDNGQPVLDAHGNEVYHYPGDLLPPYQ